MRRLSYFKRASRRFLTGTRHHTPAEAVEAGARTLEQWVNTLSEERELEGAYQIERKMCLQQRRFGIDQLEVQAGSIQNLTHTTGQSSPPLNI